MDAPSDFRLKDAISISVATCLQSAATGNTPDDLDLKYELDLVHKNLLCLTALLTVTLKKSEKRRLPPQVGLQNLQFPNPIIPRLNKVFHLDTMLVWNFLLSSRANQEELDSIRLAPKNELLLREEEDNQSE